MSGSEEPVSGSVDRAGLRALSREYRSREIRPLGVWEPGGHLVKAYAIRAPGREADPFLLDRARDLAARQSGLDASVGGLGVGAAIVHQGGDGDYVVVVNWVEGFMTRTSIFAGPAARPRELRPAPVGLSPCLWELAVIAHEREAFARRIIAAADMDAGIAAWREDVFSGRV